MKREEALAILRSQPEMRRAVLLLVDEALLDLESRLLNSSVSDAVGIVAARHRLDGGRSLSTTLAKVMSAPVKP